MSHVLGLAIESLVAVLLMLTIGYCWLLNKRLQRLKADEHSLKATIAELITATEIAERAIGGLKHAVRDVNENLGNQLDAATQMSALLKTQLAEGDGVVRRLSKIALAARPSEPARAPAQAAAPAAPAVQGRRRLRRAWAVRAMAGPAPARRARWTAAACPARRSPRGPAASKEKRKGRNEVSWFGSFGRIQFAAP